MPRFSALIHVKDNGKSLGRALETLRACDEIIVVDHGGDETLESTTRSYGARLLRGIPGVEPGAHAVDSRNNWILCLQPFESVAEGLEASLLEWSRTKSGDIEVAGYSIAVREESGDGWVDLPPELRLVDRRKINWTDALPPNATHAEVLPGHLLRFRDE